MGSKVDDRDYLFGGVELKMQPDLHNIISSQSWVRPVIQVAKVCFEVFDDPVFCGGRPCQHVFCRACVEQCLVAESSSQDAASRAACVQFFADPVQISTYTV